MATIGYARVSSRGQSLEVQEEQLRAAGCERIFAEKRSGTSTAGRDELGLALDFVRDGDVFVVTRLDRLARSLEDLRGIIGRLTAKGVGFRCLQQGAIDTTTAEGRLFLNILGSFAEWETEIRKERQADGIAKAKADDLKRPKAERVYKGRKPSVNVEAVRRLRAEGVRPAEIARRLKIGRASVYRALGEEG